MSTPDRSHVIRLTEAQARIPGPAGERAVMVLQRGTLDVALGLPLRPSQQTPHAQDEIYFIIRRGVLIHDSKRDRFQSGDLLFVAAGTEHQFLSVVRIPKCPEYALLRSARASSLSPIPRCAQRIVVGSTCSCRLSFSSFSNARRARSS